MDIREMDAAYVAGTYKRFPLQIVSGKGSIVRDEEGKEYIDMGSGIAVTSFGVADEIWQKAVTDQIGKVQHMSNLYYTEPCALLAKELCGRTGMKKVFFSNSGAEANECAIKTARKYSEDHYGPGRFTIATLKNSFHGRTITTLSATGQDHYHELFRPLTPGFIHLEAEDIPALEAAAAEGNLAAVMIECVQGEGGVVPLSPGYAEAVGRIARENDILLIVDEVQTGNGRSGSLYAYMNYGLQPDIVSTAKGLAGGLPLGATLLGEKTENVLGYGDHGSTFGGNPVCCAAALSVLNRLDGEFLASVREKSDYLFKTFTGAKGVQSVSGMGLMIGLKTDKPAGQAVRECMEQGVLCLTAKDRVRLLPALNIPMDTLKKAAEVILSVCAG